VCRTTNASGASCNGARCSYMCHAGFADCSPPNTPNVNGCETRIDTTANCGACGQTCRLTNASAAMCLGGTRCLYTCNPGFADCNSDTTPNTNGCETALNTTRNCGACGSLCDLGGALSATCDGTRCGYNCRP